MKIRFSEGRDVSIDDANADHTVEDVIRLAGANPDSFRILFGGKLLRLSDRISEMNLPQDATFLCIPKPKSSAERGTLERAQRYERLSNSERSSVSDEDDEEQQMNTQGGHVHLRNASLEEELLSFGGGFFVGLFLGVFSMLLLAPLPLLSFSFFLGASSKHNPYL
mmetsp:Transcript_5192/g.11412  ORF Transcript_5192/g.11412 Transcript_5192/m.11412 type:complete len:166 (-) Transcript_5192:1732-2229(-)